MNEAVTLEIAPDFSGFRKGLRRFALYAAMVATGMGRLVHARARSEALGALNDLQTAVEAAGIEPSYHVNPDQDIWRQMDQIRLKLVSK